MTLKFYRMPSGKIAAHSGRPVWLTQQNFEDCCCQDPDPDPEYPQTLKVRIKSYLSAGPENEKKYLGDSGGGETTYTLEKTDSGAYPWDPKWWGWTWISDDGTDYQASTGYIEVTYDPSTERTRCRLRCRDNRRSSPESGWNEYGTIEVGWTAILSDIYGELAYDVTYLDVEDTEDELEEVEVKES